MIFLAWILWVKFRPRTVGTNLEGIIDRLWQCKGIPNGSTSDLVEIHISCPSCSSCHLCELWTSLYANVLSTRVGYCLTEGSRTRNLWPNCLTSGSEVRWLQTVPCSYVWHLDNFFIESDFCLPVGTFVVPLWLKRHSNLSPKINDVWLGLSLLCAIMLTEATAPSVRCGVCVRLVQLTVRAWKLLLKRLFYC